MKVGIIGLGLMGGSLAKAISFGTEHTVWGTNRSEEAIQKALFVGAIEKELTKEDLCKCDLVMVSLYPQASIDYINENAHLFKKGAIVMDISGVKRYVCDALYETAKANGIKELYDDIAIDNSSVSLFLKCGFAEVLRTSEFVLVKKEI